MSIETNFSSNKPIYLSRGTRTRRSSPDCGALATTRPSHTPKPSVIQKICYPHKISDHLVFLNKSECKLDRAARHEIYAAKNLKKSNAKMSHDPALHYWICGSCATVYSRTCHMNTDGQLENFTVIKIEKLVAATLQNKTILVLRGIDILSSGCKVSARFYFTFSWKYRCN